MGIAETIKELRTSSGMSQQSLSDRLYVSRDLVSKWECGTRCPDTRMLEKIAAVFGVSVDSVFTEKPLFLCELAECFPDDETGEEDLITLLNNFLHKESAKNADVFLKRYYFQKSISEISEEYGIGENHVRSILSKTRKRLGKFAEETKK